MKLKSLIMFILVFLSLLIWRVYALHIQRVNAEQTKIDVVQEVIKTPKEYIKQYANQYKIAEETLLRIAVCESKLNKDAINYNDGGKGKHSVGIMQFQESTFLKWENKIGIDLDFYSYHDQIRLAAYMLSKGQGEQWTCYRMIST